MILPGPREALAAIDVERAAAWHQACKVLDARAEQVRHLARPTDDAYYRALWADAKRMYRRHSRELERLLDRLGIPPTEPLLRTTLFENGMLRRGLPPWYPCTAPGDVSGGTP